MTGASYHGRRLAVAAITVAAVAAWLPFVTRQLGPDEGGFLLVGSQWSPGTSLYGDYWVDRPPLLIALFGLADQLGGAVALRVMGIAFVVVGVLLSAVLGARTSGSARGGVVPAAVAAVFLSSPLFGTTAVNGELLAIPFVLGGVAALIWSCTAARPRSAVAWAVAAGALGAGAALIKQNVVDVFVFAAVLTVQVAWARRGREALGRLAAFGAGALVVATLAVSAAAALGTGPGELWNAVVTFRFDAAAVIHSSDNEGTSDRFHSLLVAFLWSGAPLVLAASIVRLRRAADPSAGRSPPVRVLDLRWPAAAMVVWELVAVGLGGSYWLHYLIGVVPGLVLLVTAAGQRPRARASAVLVVATVYAALAGIAMVGWNATHMPINEADAAVVDYLRAHAQAGDSVVVAFGHPNIVHDVGMASPYSELWSLPVRVRDNRLVDLTAVLDGVSRPTWVVVSGAGLATWGVEVDTAQAHLEERYERVASIEGYVIYLVDGAVPVRSVAGPPA